MDLSAKLYQVLYSLLTQLPSFLMIGGCLVFSIIRWKRHPRVSLTVVVALLLLGAHIVVFAFVYAFVPNWFAQPGEFKTRETVYLVISFIYNLMMAVILGILLAAIFMRRSRPDRAAGEV